MPYPEKILADDEQVVEHLHPHWITLVPATLWFLVICAAAGFGIAYAPDSGTGHTIVLIIVIVLALGLLAWLSLTPLIQWRTTHYVFTTHRLLIRRGVLRHQGRDIALQRISDVAFSQSLWDRMVKAGTLTIESAGEHGQEQLTNLPRSDQQQQLLNRLIEQDGERRSRIAYGGAPQGYYPRGGATQGAGYPDGPGYAGGPGYADGPGYPDGQSYPDGQHPTRQYTRPQPPYPPQQ